jgi:mannose-6-phosphate isomerase-like protein (cupin superfamily)
LPRYSARDGCERHLFRAASAGMSETKPYPYVTRLNVQFQPLELIDEKAVSDAVTDRWFNQTLAKVNDSVVRLGVVEGEYHWHKHDNDDEFFYVVSGRFLIDIEGRTIDLRPRQGVVIPKGVLHRPRAPERTVILMVETSAIVPTGD